jgi:pimeloyl-ACP methyl ester carboxylesterase
MATFALIPGAGGSAWYWHRVTPLLTDAGAEVVAVDLPAADDSADLNTYADVVCRAVGQSMGAFTAPIVATRVPTSAIVLVNPMVPAAGESPGTWWDATGQRADRVAYFARIGLGDRNFDEVEDFFHDVPDAVRAEAFSQPEPYRTLPSSGHGR